jgi:hypothetical protein
VAMSIFEFLTRLATLLPFSTVGGIRKAAFGGAHDAGRYGNGGGRQRCVTDRQKGYYSSDWYGRVGFDL